MRTYATVLAAFVTAIALAGRPALTQEAGASQEPPGTSSGQAHVLAVAEDAIAAAQRFLECRTFTSISAARVTTLEDSWVFHREVSGSHPAWHVRIVGCVLDLNSNAAATDSDRTAATFGPLDLDVMLRASDGAVLGASSTWPRDPSDRFDVLNRASSEYLDSVRRDGERWTGPARPGATLAGVLRVVFGRGLSRRDAVEQMLVNVYHAEALVAPDKRVRWSVEFRCHASRHRLGGPMEGRPPTDPEGGVPPNWNHPDAVRSRLVSMMRYTISDTPVEFIIAGNSPWPIVVDRAPAQPDTPGTRKPE